LTRTRLPFYPPFSPPPLSFSSKLVLFLPLGYRSRSRPLSPSLLSPRGGLAHAVKISSPPIFVMYYASPPFSSAFSTSQNRKILFTPFLFASRSWTFCSTPLFGQGPGFFRVQHLCLSPPFPLRAHGRHPVPVNCHIISGWFLFSSSILPSRASGGSRASWSTRKEGEFPLVLCYHPLGAFPPPRERCVIHPLFPLHGRKYAYKARPSLRDPLSDRGVAPPGVFDGV